MLEEIIVREVKPEDLKRIYEIEVESFKEPYPIGLLYSYLLFKDKCFLAAEVDGEIVGYLIATVRRKVIGHIISVAVDPRYRRRGIATTLMKAAELILRKRGVKVFRLEVRVSNEPAIKMYERLGYRIGYKKNSYYRDGEDAYVMFKLARRRRGGGA